MINININIPCVYPNYHCHFKSLRYKSNIPYCSYCSIFNSKYATKEHENIMQTIYTTKNKSLALLNIKSPIHAIRLVANFILGLNHCVFKHPTDRSNYLNLKD
jgi:hypothetical protein